MLDINTKAQLTNNPLSIRQKLTLPPEARFGLEIELENVDLDEVKYLIHSKFGSSWLVKEDRSLLKDNNAEIATPVLKNSKSYWEILKKLSELIEKMKPTFGNCSFQINFDGSLLPTIEDRMNFLKFYAYYEDIIYRFSKGDDKYYRESIDMYAYPIILALRDALNYEKKEKEWMLERFNNQKRYGINFKTEDKDLIEFRTPNGTTKLALWQNYITFFYYLILAVKHKKYDMQELNNYIDSYFKMYILENYELPREEKALKLSKKIFNNQVDRIYFLQQYIGNR